MVGSTVEEKRRRAPVRREVDDLPDEHARDRGALKAAQGRRSAGGPRTHHSISSPVRRTKTSSRLAGRRSPSGTRPSASSMPSTEMLVPVRRVANPALARPELGLRELRRRAVDLDGLAPGVLGDELRRRPGGDRASVRHDQDRVGEALRLLDVVRRHEDRRPLGPERVDQRPELLPDLGIEADGGLVEQDEARAVDERAGDQQAPAHPPGELVHPAVAAIDEVGHLQRALDRGASVGPADPVEMREDEQVLLDGQRRVEVVELRRDPALGPGGLGLLGQPEAEHLELALVGDRLGRQQAHGRGLARAVGPEQADARALGHVQVEPVDGGDRPVALDDAAQADGELLAHTLSLPGSDRSTLPPSPARPRHAGPRAVARGAGRRPRPPRRRRPPRRGRRRGSRR